MVMYIAFRALMGYGFVLANNFLFYNFKQIKFERMDQRLLSTLIKKLDKNTYRYSILFFSETRLM